MAHWPQKDDKMRVRQRLLCSRGIVLQSGRTKGHKGPQRTIALKGCQCWHVKDVLGLFSEKSQCTALVLPLWRSPSAPALRPCCARNIVGKFVFQSAYGSERETKYSSTEMSEHLTVSRILRSDTHHGCIFVRAVGELPRQLWEPIEKVASRTFAKRRAWHRADQS